MFYDFNSDKPDLKLLVKSYKQRGSEELKEQIVEHFMPMIKFFAHKYSRGAEDFEDLVQVGSIGLLKALNRFNPSLNSDFTSYAIPTILGEMKRYLRDNSWLLKVPRHLKELKGRIDKVIPSLQLKLGRSPTLEDISSALGVSKEEVIEAMDMVKPPVSLNLKVGENEGYAIEEKIQAEEKEFQKLEDLAELENILKELSPMEKYVLYLKFFYGLSQTEIAKKLNVSQMTVSRIQNKAIRKLKEKLRQGVA